MADDADTHEKDVEEIDERMQKLTHKLENARGLLGLERITLIDGVVLEHGGFRRSTQGFCLGEIVWMRQMPQRPQGKTWSLSGLLLLAF